MMIDHVAVAIGHHPDAPGAALQVGDHTTHEYDLWQPFARVFRTLLQRKGIDVSVLQRPAPEAIREVAEVANKAQADVAIELHYNAAENSDAVGSECVHWPDAGRASHVGRVLAASASDTLGTPNRGVKPMRLPFLGATKMPAIITEPAFGSNESDAWKLLNGQMKLAHNWAQRLARIDAHDQQAT